MAATQSSSPTTVEQRARTVQELGFCEREALLLAAVRAPGFTIDLERVKRMLEAGCRPELAVRILI
ncbi:MAG TPA: hypothetical protein VHX88_21520 [Solirubrobacteraceae bacterium]|nr:hypothetical protein [Solirubrobacteraceae bacterium]